MDYTHKSYLLIVRLQNKGPERRLIDAPASALQFGSTTPRTRHSQGLFRVLVRWSTRTLNPDFIPNPDPNPSLNPKPYP